MPAGDDSRISSLCCCSERHLARAGGAPGRAAGRSRSRAPPGRAARARCRRPRVEAAAGRGAGWRARGRSREPRTSERKDVAVAGDVELLLDARRLARQGRSAPRVSNSPSQKRVAQHLARRSRRGTSGLRPHRHQRRRPGAGAGWRARGRAPARARRAAPRRAGRGRAPGAAPEPAVPAPRRRPKARPYCRRSSAPWMPRWAGTTRPATRIPPKKVSRSRVKPSAAGTLRRTARSISEKVVSAEEQRQGVREPVADDDAQVPEAVAQDRPGEGERHAGERQHGERRERLGQLAGRAIVGQAVEERRTAGSPPPCRPAARGAGAAAPTRAALEPARQHDDRRAPRTAADGRARCGRAARAAAALGAPDQTKRPFAQARSAWSAAARAPAGRRTAAQRRATSASEPRRGIDEEEVERQRRQQEARRLVEAK